MLKIVADYIVCVVVPPRCRLISVYRLSRNVNTSNNKITTNYLTKFWILENNIYLCTSVGEKTDKWSDGRVARQRSAKPRTAVRIRFRPPKLQSRRLNKSSVCVLLCLCERAHKHPKHKQPSAIALLLQRTAHLWIHGCGEIVLIVTII